MRGWVARVRPSLLVIGVGLAGPTALAFDFGDSGSPAINAPAFPAFIDPTHFVELAAAHKALLAQIAGQPAALAPGAADVRRRAEELGWGVHAPKGAQAPTAVAEPASDESAAWEAAARRAADELAREQARTSKEPTVAPPSAKAATKPAPGAKGEVKTIGKLDPAAAKPAAADGKEPVKPTTPASKQAPPAGSGKPPEGTAKVVPPPKKTGQLAAPSALGAVIKDVTTPSWRSKALPKEPGAFGWDYGPN